MFKKKSVIDSNFLLKLKDFYQKKKRENARNCTLLVCRVISCGRSLIVTDKMAEDTYVSFVGYLHTEVIRTLQVFF